MLKSTFLHSFSSLSVLKIIPCVWDFSWVSWLRKMQPWTISRSRSWTPALTLTSKRTAAAIFSISIPKKNLKLQSENFLEHFVRTMREGKYHYRSLILIAFFPSMKMYIWNIFHWWKLPININNLNLFTL